MVSRRVSRLGYEGVRLAGAGHDGIGRDAARGCGSIGPPRYGDAVRQFDGAQRFSVGTAASVGSWFTPEQIAGIELSGFGIDGRDIEFDADSDRFAVLARPYFDATGGVQDALLTAYPDLWVGETSVRADFELSGAEALFRRAVHWTPNLRVDVLAGYRYARLRDSLQISTASLSLDPATGFPADALVERGDQFRVTNNFHGGQLGLATRCWRGCWSLSAVAKVALGGVRSRSRVAGASSVSEIIDGEFVTADFPGGLLAVPPTSAARR